MINLLLRDTHYPSARISKHGSYRRYLTTGSLENTELRRASRSMRLGVLWLHFWRGTMLWIALGIFKPEAVKRASLLYGVMGFLHEDGRSTFGLVLTPVNSICTPKSPSNLSGSNAPLKLPRKATG